MNITILTYGSRGDVQPFIALSRGLQENGHKVRVAAPYRFADFVTGYGIPFVPLAGDPEEISRRFTEAGHNAVRTARAIRDYVMDIAQDVVGAASSVCDDAEMIIHSFLFTTGAHSIAYARGIPDLSIQTFPVFAPTRAYPPVALPSLPAGPLSYLGHWLITQTFWYGGNAGYKQLRKGNPATFSFDLYWPFKEKPTRPATPLLYAVSPIVLPPAPDSVHRAHVIGYFFLDSLDDYQAPVELTDFLDAGPAPICVTFGSMIHSDMDSVEAAVLRAVRLTGNRAIILTGWNGWKGGGSTEDVFFLESAPHDWLLPRCKAVIHHGGAGTTAAGLRAGIPNIVIPFGGDQLFWGKRIHAIGAGPPPINVRSLTTARLSRALVEVNNIPMQKCAREIGLAIRAETGIANAIRVVESCRW